MIPYAGPGRPPVDPTVLEWRKEAGAKLRRLRIRGGFSQRSLARKLGWHGMQVCALEQGARPFTREKLWKLATALRIQPSRIAEPEDA